MLRQTSLTKQAMRHGKFFLCAGQQNKINSQVL